MTLRASVHDRRVGDSVEFFSVQRAEQAVARCDLAVLVLDAQLGVTAQDKKVAGKIAEHNKACVILVNKWDLLDADVKSGAKELRQRERRPRTARASQLR